MTWAQDVRAGWRVARPSLDAVFTARRRRIVWATTTLLGVGGSAAVHALFTAGMSEPAASCASFAAGSGAAVVFAFVISMVWRLPRTTETTAKTTTRFTGGGVAVGEGVEREISSAWHQGREPNIAIDQRLAAAERSRRYLAATPRMMPASIALMGLPVPYLVGCLAVLPNFAVFAGAFGVVNAVVSPLLVLAALGRAKAAIETAPEVPEHLEADGRKKRVPVKSLGTDHPDDYR